MKKLIALLCLFTGSASAALITNSFTQANEDPLASNGWSTADGQCELEVISNAVAWDDDGADCVALYDTATAAVYIEARVAVVPDGNDFLYLIWGATEGKAGPTTDFYGARLQVSHVYIFRFDNSGFVDISGGGAAVTVATNDVWRLFRSGNDIVITQNSVERSRVTDTTYMSGKAGLGAYTAAAQFNARWDDSVIDNGVSSIVPKVQHHRRRIK